MSAEKSAQIMVRMTPDLLDALKRDADENERTVAQTIRLAVKRFLSAAGSVSAAKED